MLSEKQLEIVDFVGPAAMVVAGPGSGKTTTLSAAIEAEVQRGTDERQILVVTFTRMAAHQMRAKLEDIGISHASVGTFHSICYSLIRANWQQLGYSSRQIEVVDRQEQRAMIKESIASCRHSPPISRVEEVLSSLGQNYEMPDGVCGDTQTVVDDYMRRLREANAVDYPLVPYLGIQAAELSGAKWDCVFVDECQDLDYAQWRLFKVIAPRRLLAVGDPDQLLYSWRGADVDLMRQMSKEWQAEILKLEENYRCPTLVAGHANNLIAHNQDRIEKTIECVREDAGVVECVPESWLINRLTSELAEDNSDQTYAVLGRTHRSLMVPCQMMIEAGLEPKIASQSEKLLERDDIRAILALLAFQDLPMSSRLADRVWSMHKWGNLKKDRTRSDCRSKAKGFFEATLSAIPVLKDLYAEELSLSERFGLVARYVNTIYGSLTNEDIHRIGKIVARFIREHPFAERTGDRLIAWINMRDGQDDVEPNAKLNVMTIHASKGLEFDHVFVVGLDDWTLPLRHSHKSTAAIEEERRLLFVAITRAKRTLHLALPEEHWSRFIEEAKFPDLQAMA